MHILMVAAENGALPGAKIGGIGDVIRDVPLALAANGHRATVLTPGYQALSRLPGARWRHNLTVEFGSQLEQIELFSIDLPGQPEGVEHLVLEHPLFAACGAGRIYCHDAHEPFATDAGKFALFCQAVCMALATEAIADVDVLHLHDWHSALTLLLRDAHPAFQSLRRIRSVFTVHNLSLQGVRPFDDNWSSPGRWFPSLKFARPVLADPHAPHCINLMRTGINLADRVHVVSPTYAREILEPSRPELGQICGEGLEADLQVVNEAGRLHGILNGCDYHIATSALRKPSAKRFIEAATETLTNWVGLVPTTNAAHFLAQQRLMQWALARHKDRFLVASIGRLTAQKAGLLREPGEDGVPAIDRLLQELGSGFMIMLGSGDSDCERYMLDVMRRHRNFLFLCGYSESLAALLYSLCDLFLMPSTFEPCGISQMLAMRAGKPCLVHKVGGLADTVRHMVNGLSFGGANPRAQVVGLLQAFSEAQDLYLNRRPLWQELCRNAAAARFSWDESVQAYERLLYR